MTKHAFDPEFLPYIDLLPVESDFSTAGSVGEVRLAREEWYSADSTDRVDVSISEMSIPGDDAGSEIPLRVYRPTSAAHGTRAAVMEIHGGGFMIGSLEMVDPFCQLVSSATGAVVVSVDYRLAPEHPYPAPVDDCYIALVWMADHAAELGIDPERIAIAGQSGGAGLAAATALMARDRNGPAICFQWLEIPELDDRLATESMIDYVDTPVWNRPNAVWSWKHYLAGIDGDDVPAYAAPARAIDLSGLPAAYITVMQFDPLRDEGIEYARRLMHAGVHAELHAYPGTFHGSTLLSDVEVSRRGTADSIAAVTRALRPR